MLLWIILAPLLGFVANLALGRRLSKTISGGLACLAALGSLIVALLAVRALNSGAGRAIEQTVYGWLASGDFRAPFMLRLDPLSALMILVVSGIGFLVHVYSIGYMQDEPDAEYARFFSYMNLFMAFMLVLVLAANFLVLFIGWEGVGLCSYLLIGFWYEKTSAADAGKKAFIVTRIGDAVFVLGILLAFVRFGTLDFERIAGALAAVPAEPAFGTLSTIALLLLAGAVGKSAQMPLHVWLPDAMEGPTPVSAYMHAATMVTAGVFVIGRNAVLFSHAPQVLFVTAVIGTATAFFAATVGLVQDDIKRVLAYSTISQLGYMFLAMGAGAFAVGIFHLYTHAFFKALLFLSAGAVIHALSGEQRLDRMGGLRRTLPVAFWTFVAGALAISGVPGTSGFFSKDEILFRAYASGHRWLWALATITSFMTALYVFRLVFLVFYGRPAVTAPGEPGSSPDVHTVGGDRGPHVHRMSPSMAIPIVLLAVGSLVAGYVGVPSLLGGSNRIEKFLAPSFEASPSPAAERTVDAAPDTPAIANRSAEPGAGIEGFLMTISVVAALAGIAVAALFFLTSPQAASSAARRVPGLHRLLVNKYYVDQVYDAAVVRPLDAVSREGLWRGVDVSLVDRTVNLVASIVAGVGSTVRWIQTGSMRVYAAWLLLGIVVILGYYAGW